MTTAVIDFNLRRAPMNNVKVRQALFHAIDRQRIVQDVYQGLAETAKNAIPTQFIRPTANNALFAFNNGGAGCSKMGSK